MNNILCTDIETTGLEQWSRELCFNAAYITSPEEIMSFTVDQFVDHVIHHKDRVSMHNGYSFDIPWIIYQERKFYNTNKLYAYLANTPHSVIDTLLISRLCYPNLMKHSLAEWIERLKPTYKYLQSKVKIADDEWNEENIDLITHRNHLDVKAQCAITQHFIDMRCMGEQAVLDYHSANRFILDLSINGLPFNKAEASDVYATRILKANRKIINVQRTLGETATNSSGKTVPMNLNSNAHIHQALLNLYGKGLPLGEPSKKTKKQSPIFNQKNARFVVKDFPILNDLLEYREAMNLAKFVEPINSKKSFMSRYRDGRIYPSVNMIEARTLRSSYSNPPCQQFPDDMKALVQGNILDMDFSGLEMQVLGYELKETFGETFIWDMNQNGTCPKQATADCLGSLLDNIEPEKRLSVSKTVNYAVLFGQQAKNTLNVLKLDRSYETELKQALDKRFPALNLLTNYLKSNMRDGCILNLFGQRVQSPEYCVINTFTQSSGALYAVKLLPLVYEHLTYYTKLLAFVHDEMLLEIVKAIEEEEINLAIFNGYQDFMEKYNFPIISELNWSRGENWYEAH